MKQSLSILLLRNLSFRKSPIRNLWRLEFVQLMTNIRLGTGRGFRYAYRQQFLLQEARKDAFVEPDSTPHLAVSATGEKEWAI